MTETEWLACADARPMIDFLRRKASDRKLRLFACACCRASCPQGIGPKKAELFAVSEAYADGGASQKALRKVWGGPCWPETPAKWACGAARSRSPAQQQRRADLARCVFGNPFRDVTVNSAWLTADAVAMAQSAYEERLLPSGHLDPARLAILADALEECGCADESVIAHLRSPGPHVRGCWALDLCLGKE